MSNFDYETNARNSGVGGTSGGLGLLLLLLVVIGLLALFSFFGGGTTPDVSGQTETPAAPATAVD